MKKVQHRCQWQDPALRELKPGLLNIPGNPDPAEMDLRVFNYILEIFLVFEKSINGDLNNLVKI